METTMFTLGVLAMIMVMLIAVVIVGVVKVFKMSKQIKEYSSNAIEIERLHEQYIADVEREGHSQLRDIRRDINMIEATISNRMDHELKAVSDQSNSYTDKRIDKLVDTYFMVKEAEQTNKKLIKG